MSPSCMGAGQTVQDPAAAVLTPSSACTNNYIHLCCAAVLSCVPSCAQAVNGGSPTYFGITVPFDLNTLLAVVSSRSR